MGLDPPAPEISWRDPVGTKANLVPYAQWLIRLRLQGIARTAAHFGVELFWLVTDS
jgi:hypothetical protein